MGTIPGQIIGELSEIGKQVGGEVTQVPKDIAEIALESLGAKGSGKTQGSTQPGKQNTAWEQIDVEQDKKIKRAMARQALEELTKGSARRPKEPSIWERLQMEADEKKKQEVQAQQTAVKQQLSVPASKRLRGDLYGTKAKQTATENRNVRQD
jgi:hypothetical protein